MREIQNQTGYSFTINDKSLSLAEPVTITTKQQSLKQVLNSIFKNQPLTYRIDGKLIMIIDKSKDNPKPAEKQNPVRGRVVDETGSPLAGASIKVKDQDIQTSTNQTGTFLINNALEGATLIIGYMGFESREVDSNTDIGTIVLSRTFATLDVVDVTVSTGYQNIPKERATGAFTQVDNNTLNRNVGINVLDRLEGVTSGLLLNRNLPTQGGANNSKISIRGRSTLFATPEPLIILDGFPYEGNIDQINPADIENITILKDAAAASIWGTKAGNGVIVITSKTGKQNQPLQINLSTTLSVAGKPNLYYQPQISSSDYIDIEKFLFDKGYYDGTLNMLYSTVSPAVELFDQYRNNLLSDQDLSTKINQLKSQDVRKDLEKYFYRPTVNQQYQLNLNGGSQNNAYYLSLGYDQNQSSYVTNKDERISLNAKNTYALFNGKLKLSGDITFNTLRNNNKNDQYTPYTPYDRVADDNGNSLSVVSYNTLRETYTDNAGNGKLLDWKYRPKDELNNFAKRTNNQIKTIVGLNFEIVKGLDLIGSFQYLKENTTDNLNYPLEGFYTRNKINTYSTISNNTVKRVIELGDILQKTDFENTSKIGRVQLNFNKTFGTDHEVNAIAGFDGSDTRLNTTGFTLYGYDEDTRTNRNDAINPTTFYPFFYEPSDGSQIPTAPSIRNLTNIGQSIYSNASYGYKERYMLSGSIRQDKSNLFGVRTNQKAVPLWSVGAAWLISKEDFLNVEWLDFLKLRTTFGYSGNVDKSVSGLLTALNWGLLNSWQSVYAMIQNPPNPDLRWEQIKTWNFGLDFKALNNRISGSIDYYNKNAFDLIGNSEIAMQSGITQFRGNNADLRSQGFDLLLSSQNLTGKFSWNTDLILNHNFDKVTNYKFKQSSNSTVVSQNYSNPLEGYPYYAVYSFPSAGLDNQGKPQGYFDGELSQDYSKILTTFAPEQLTYHGSASPKYFGNLINTFGYKNIELSFSIAYKMDYYFRRVGISNGILENSYTSLQDYDKRWQKPGDEAITKIPASEYPSNYQAANFFSNSSDLVEKGDHIRLQDIRLSYLITKNQHPKLPLRSITAFAYARNIGILWQKNKIGIDPDFGSLNQPLPLNVSFGLNLTL